MIKNLKHILFVISSLIVIQCQQIDQNTTHISVYTESANKTEQAIHLSILYKLYKVDIIQVEVPKGQIEQIKQKLQQYNRLQLSESVYTYEQIYLIEKSEFLINLNNIEIEEHEDQSENDNHDIIYRGNQFLSSQILAYYLNKIGCSYDGQTEYIYNQKALGEKDEFLFKTDQDEIKNNFQALQQKLMDHTYLSEKIAQSRWDLINIIKQNITESEIEQAKQKYQNLSERYYSLIHLLFTADEVEYMNEHIVRIELDFVEDQEKLSIILLQEIMKWNTILYKNNQNLKFVEVKQQIISIYHENIEKVFQYVYFSYENVQNKYLEVPNEQFQTIIERMSYYLNVSQRQIKLKIISSSLDSHHITLLTKLKYFPLYMIKDTGFIILKHNSLFLSTILEIDNLVKGGKSREDAYKYGFISLVSRAGYRHFYRIAENIFGRKNLFTVFNKIIDWFAQFLPRGVYERIATKIFSHKVSGAAASSSFRKLFRTQLVSSGLITGAFVIWDVTKLIRGQLTGSEFVKAQIANGASVLGATLGGAYGMALGPVGSFFGGVAGGIGGYFAGDYLSSQLPKTDAELIAKYAEEKLEYFSTVLTQKEVEQTITIFRTSQLENLTEQKAKTENWKGKVEDRIISILKLQFKKRDPRQIVIEAD